MNAFQLLLLPLSSLTILYNTIAIIGLPLGFAISTKSFSFSQQLCQYCKSQTYSIPAEKFLDNFVGIQAHQFLEKIKTHIKSKTTKIQFENFNSEFQKQFPERLKIANLK